jgi:hypothetical protein
MGIADQANVAAEIYSGRATELAERISSSLPEYVAAIHPQFTDSEWYEPALRRIADVYEASRREAPDEVKRLIGTLPPRPSCRKNDEVGVEAGATPNKAASVDHTRAPPR